MEARKLFFADNPMVNNPEDSELQESGYWNLSRNSLMRSEDEAYKSYVEQQEDKYLSSLTLPNVRQMEDFANYTKDFYRLLHIPESELFKGSKRMRIKQMPLIVSGYAGIGKTTVVNCLVHAIQSWYGKEKCNVVYTKEFPLSVLLYLGFKGFPKLGWDAKKPIQVLIFDDATAVKVSREEQRQFFSVRHLMHRETGLKEGICYTIFVTHGWYMLDVRFRRSAIFSTFLSVPLLDLYARHQYGKILGKKGVEVLQYMAPKALRFDRYKGTGLCVLLEIPKGHKTNIGYFYWQDLSADYWTLEYEKENVEPHLDDQYRHIIKYHPKEEAKKLMSKKEAEKLLEEKRRKNREKQRRYYWRQKEKLEKAQ